MSTLKFKGVTRGKTTGDIIEFSAEEKVPVALQSAVASSDIYKGKHLVSVSEVKIQSLNFAPKGESLRKMWQNNNYNAEGTAKFSMRDIHKDMMLRPSVKSFKIQFEDSLDTLGLPDLKIVNLQVD